MAAGATYEPIATTTTTTATNTITFSNIPQTYTDLILIVNAIRDTGSSDDHLVRFNSDSGSNYSRTYLYGDGTNYSGGQETNQTSARLIYLNSSVRGVPQLHIMNYSNSVKYKTVLQRQNLPDTVTAINCASWRSNNAITSITITTPANNFAANSYFTLYGIAAA